MGDIEQLENKDLIQNISNEIDLTFAEIKATALAFKAIFSREKLLKLNEFIQQWYLKKDTFEIAYELSKGNSQSSQQQLLEIQRIEKRLSEINKIISDRKLLLKEIGTPEEDFTAQRLN